MSESSSVSGGQLHAVLNPPGLLGSLGSLDHYEAERVLGVGGMGVVVGAVDTCSANRVAIKVLRPELAGDGHSVRRFLEEARRMRELAHDGILPVLEIVDRAPGPFFVMPWVREGSLAQWLRPGEPLNEEQVLKIAVQLARAVAHAHTHGVIHRDIKPGNVLLDAEGGVWLTDFGLAAEFSVKAVTEHQPSRRFGTAPYMSPAVAAGKAEDTRADIYSFGALLYELLTGHPPYEGDTADEVVEKVLAGPPIPVRRRNGKADPGLAAIAERAMARELRDRYASMQDVLVDLEHVSQQRDGVGTGEHGDRRAGGHSSTVVRAALMGMLAVLLLWGGMRWWGSGRASPGCFMLLGGSVLLDRHELLEEGLALDMGGGDGRVWVVSQGSEVGAYTLRGERLRSWSPDSRLMGSLTQPALVEAGGSNGVQFAVGWLAEDGPMVTLLGGDFRLRRNLRLPAPMEPWNGDEPGEKSWKPQRAVVGLTPRSDGLFMTREATGPGGKQLVGCLDMESGQWKWIWGTTNSRAGLRTQMLRGFGPGNEPHVLVWAAETRLGAGGGPDTFGQVYLLDMGGRLVGEIHVSRGIVDCLVADVNRDGEEEILLADRSGVVTQLDARLSLIKTQSVGLAPAGGQGLLRLHAAADMDLDGRVEVLCSWVQVGNPTVVDLAAVMKPGGAKPGVEVRLLLLGDDLKIVSDVELGPAASHVGGFGVVTAGPDEQGWIQLICAGGSRLSLVTCAPAS